MLLICGLSDRKIPCRHSETIYNGAIGANELGRVPSAGHEKALATEPQEFQRRGLGFFGEAGRDKPMCRWENSGAEWQKDNREIGKIKLKTHPQTARVGHPPRSLKLRGVKGSCNLRAAVQIHSSV